MALSHPPQNGGHACPGVGASLPLKPAGRPRHIGTPRASRGTARARARYLIGSRFSAAHSGHLTLTIVVSGHFFISQGRTVLEGFSLIDSHKWLKIVRRADCLLLRAQSKNECRMFRVQFGGDSKEQMLEHCCSCVQKLAEYVPVQVTDEQSQNLYHSLSQLPSGDNEVKDTEQNTSVLYMSVLKKKSELPLVYQHAAWRAQELGPFIRLCLMDQNFPAFVEDVEKELKKITEG
uniref:REC114 meiotic recombination protein n=1 Tax=Athene cunicularia TaxID=194338 RepID=A0A663MCE9_ATHCN